jgi:predicted O-methyltransferase YrrM
MQTLSITRYDIPSIINARGYKRAVEVGLDHGYFSYYLLKHSALRMLWSVDSFQGKWAALEPEVRSMLSEFGDRSRIFIGTSAAAAGFFSKAEAGFDLVYIDANHRFQAIKQDLHLWWPLIRPGGMLAGHDYIAAGGCGVIEAVDEFAAERNLEVQLTREPWATWMITL